MNALWLRLVAALVWCATANGHGRLIEPPSRASAWRYGFDTPHNYDDHQLYCGGFTRQWNRNGGKCGVCGDAWDQPTPRPHELGGRFGQGVIVRRYPPASQVTIKVELTASHAGFFEFRLCEDPKGTTQDCLDKYVLRKDHEHNDTRFYPRDGNRIYEMKYVLPEGLECAHCVLQWRYIAGNNWGMCENGTGANGCGHQEEFRACADVAIGDAFTTTTKRTRPAYVPPPRRPTAPTPEQSTGGAWYNVLIAVLALLVAVSAIAGLYLYYYRGGMRIKNLLKSRSALTVPVPPPRQKRSSLSREVPPPLVAGKGSCVLEGGFETVDLRGK